MSNLANAIASQLLWLLAVGGAARGFGWAGPVGVCVFAMLQMQGNNANRKDLHAVVVCVAIGFLCDSMFATTGMVRYASPGPWPQLAPVWIVALWASLGLTLQHSLSFLQSRLWLAALLGAMAAPSSYYAAARAWHAIDLAQPLAATLAMLAVTWAIVLPLVVLIARRQQSVSGLHIQPSELSS
ncbi:MAG: DUF2878 domain-containing protein [Lysobacter sp.]|nr:DUF2878 domain-containing protein [Lysobacter sp.]